MAQLLEELMPPTINAVSSTPNTPELQELKRFVVEAMANCVKQNEAPISQMSAEELIAKRKALLEKANGNESPITDPQTSL